MVFANKVDGTTEAGVADSSAGGSSTRSTGSTTINNDIDFETVGL